MRALMNWCECECAPAGRLSSRDEPFNLVSATGHGCALRADKRVIKKYKTVRWASKGIENDEVW